MQLLFVSLFVLLVASAYGTVLSQDRRAVNSRQLIRAEKVQGHGADLHRSSKNLTRSMMDIIFNAFRKGDKEADRPRDKKPYSKGPAARAPDADDESDDEYAAPAPSAVRGVWIDMGWGCCKDAYLGAFLFNQHLGEEDTVQTCKDTCQQFPQCGFISYWPATHWCAVMNTAQTGGKCRPQLDKGEFSGGSTCAPPQVKSYQFHVGTFSTLPADGVGYAGSYTCRDPNTQNNMELGMTLHIVKWPHKVKLRYFPLRKDLPSCIGEYWMNGKVSTPKKGKYKWSLTPGDWIEQDDCGYLRMGLEGTFKGLNGGRFEGNVTGSNGVCTRFGVHIVEREDENKKNEGYGSTTSAPPGYTSPKPPQSKPKPPAGDVFPPNNKAPPKQNPPGPYGGYDAPPKPSPPGPDGGYDAPPKENPPGPDGGYDAPPKENPPGPDGGYDAPPKENPPGPGGEYNAPPTENPPAPDEGDGSVPDGGENPTANQELSVPDGGYKAHSQQQRQDVTHDIDEKFWKLFDVETAR